MRAVVLALLLAACSSGPPEELAPPPLPQRAGIDPVIAARAEGVVFRALGDGPDFVLHIFRGDRIFLAWDYGANQQSFPKPEPILPAWNGEIYETQNEAHTLRVEIRRLACVDVNGQTLPARVTVVIDGEERTGCGRDL
jgi:hypothetical protein